MQILEVGVVLAMTDRVDAGLVQQRVVVWPGRQKHATEKRWISHRISSAAMGVNKQTDANAEMEAGKLQ